MCVCFYQGMCGQVRQQSVGVFPFLPCRSGELNSGHQAWWKIPLSVESLTCPVLGTYLKQVNHWLNTEKLILLNIHKVILSYIFMSLTVTFSNHFSAFSLIHYAVCINHQVTCRKEHHRALKILPYLPAVVSLVFQGKQIHTNPNMMMNNLNPHRKAIEGVRKTLF